MEQEMSEVYAPVLCSKCFSDNHEDCDGVARINVNGNVFCGICKCRCRNSFNRPSRVRSQGKAELLPSSAMSQLGDSVLAEPKDMAMREASGVDPSEIKLDND